jgi:hypothetical protein
MDMSIIASFLTERKESREKIKESILTEALQKK